jgi:dCTP deaminase
MSQFLYINNRRFPSLPSEICTNRLFYHNLNELWAMILSDKKILEAVAAGLIVIEPFDRACLGTNSYDVHLSKHLAVYNDAVLDARQHNTIIYFDIPDDGFVLQPGTLYLGATLEYTETHHAVPFLEGKSSVGRLGIDIHATAGKGDVGFCNHWTLEISCVLPVRVYAGMPVGQLIYFAVEGDIENFYNKKTNAKYNQRSAMPMESMMWKNKF